MELREQLAYDPLTGNFSWRVTKRGVKKGSLAGSKDSAGYWVVKVDDIRHYGHRLAVYLMTGSWPDNCVDHRNLNKSDNSWSNLRECTHAQNQGNRPIQRNNTSGFKGVYQINNRFQAKIKRLGRTTNLGMHATAEEAAKAYDLAAVEMFGEFSNLNFKEKGSVYRV